MTLNDIKKEVAQLGFESESALEQTIELAARRALSTVYTEHGARAVGCIYQNARIPTRREPIITHSNNEDNVIALSDCSYAFVISGSGSFEISDANGTRTQSFDTPKSFVYGEVHGDGEIRFKGEFRYTVYDLCVYDGFFAEGELPPEYGTLCKYELVNILPDFLCADGEPADEHGKKIEGASVLSGVLSVPYEYKGKIILKYRKRAPEVSINTPDKELCIPPELEELVPLLTAAYVWLDDDADKAQYYMSLYRDGMSAVKVYTRGGVNTEFCDTTGWA